MAEVATLFGGAPRGQPDPDIIERIEELLEEAKAGEISGIAYAVHTPGDDKKTGWIGQQGTSDAIHAAITLLAHTYSMDRMK